MQNALKISNCIEINANFISYIKQIKISLILNIKYTKISVILNCIKGVNLILYYIKISVDLHVYIIAKSSRSITRILYAKLNYISRIPIKKVFNNKVI